jgi:phage shock protein PspC (stress-responsive transcriptional regulator)
VILFFFFLFFHWSVTLSRLASSLMFFCFVQYYFYLGAAWWSIIMDDALCVCRMQPINFDDGAASKKVHQAEFYDNTRDRGELWFPCRLQHLSHWVTLIYIYILLSTMMSRNDDLSSKVNEAMMKGLSIVF